MAHLHNGIPLGHKKVGNLPFATAWMDLESILLSEISQSEKDTYHMTYLWNLRNKMNYQAIQRQTLRQRAG